MSLYYAHSKEDPQTKQLLPQQDWQSLEEHLHEVAKRAAAFASAFQMEDYGRAAGLLHDLGKATADFQKRLAGSSQRVDHSTAGAQKAIECYGKAFGRILAYVICGHHGGLPDAVSETAAAGLDDRLSRNLTLPEYCPELPSELQWKTMDRSSFQGVQLTLLIRMLFSSLVDADFLDTERFMDPERSSLRRAYPTMNELMERFQHTLDGLLDKPQDSVVNRSRRGVLLDCLEAATQDIGLFTLSVPTGGGKTLSSLAFALKHARQHGLQRIIYAIPYTSIIEQNARVLREVLGEDAVLEHHSNLLYKDDEDEALRQRLAIENWEAPVIATTNVQLFESLFAAKPSRCRKLHNLANSVIILDEAQMLPDDLLLPSLAMLKVLSSDFNASIVFCTATQPAFQPAWLDHVQPHEIVSNPQKLYRDLRRVDVEFIGHISDDALATRLAAQKQVLCIVNTRGHARQLFDRLSHEEGVFHLSALMCPQHRSQVIEEIRAYLKADERCLVISTQLIEAGVDLDFPIVYREISGSDSIAQAAGRCNREGKRTRGQVYVFEPEGSLPPGWFQRVAQYGRETLSAFPDDALGLDAIASFFNKRYSLEGISQLDSKGILRMCNEPSLVKSLSFPFRRMEDAFRFIEEKTMPIIIPFDEEARELLKQAEYATFPASYARALQRYSVGIYPYEVQELAAGGYLRYIDGTFAVLNVDDIDGNELVYSPRFGLNTKPEKGVLMP